MIESVRFLSEQAACQLIPDPRAVMISITDDGREAAIGSGWRDIVRMAFYDMIYGPMQLEFSGIEWWLQAGAISPGQAAELKELLAKLAAAPESIPLVVHCYAGRNRSGAIAKYVADTYGTPYADPLPPRFKPNKTVYELLVNPWTYITETEYQRLKWPTWRRWIHRLCGI